jgi:hydroxymethylpyrimidine pyrophosphatase-like HAD family hydrolase
MRYRLLAVDLDGTLLNSRREIPEENLAALCAAAAAGVKIAVVTGRRFPALRRYVEPLEIAGIDPFVVANSGAFIRRGLAGEILLRRFLPVATAARVLEIAYRETMEPVVHDGPDAEGHLFLREAARALPSMSRYLTQSYPQPIWVPALRLERAPVQIGFTGTVGEIRTFASKLETELARSGHAASLARTEYVDEDLSLLDVLAPQATKSEALGYLAALMEIEISSTMAIGDNWNDLGMLEGAGLGVLMANAAEELRARGLAETRANDEAGVAFAISRYLLAAGDETKKRG